MKYISFGSKMRICLVGLNLENFLFELSASGINIKNIKKHKKQLLITIDSINFDLANKLAQKYDLDIKIKKQMGFAHFVLRLPYMIGSFLGILFSVLITYFMTQTINCVQVVFKDNQSMQNHSEQKIVMFLKEQGVCAGKVFNQNVRVLENIILANFENVEKCNIKKQGSNILVYVTEKEQDKNYTKIVAQNNCIITDITTFSGRALVVAGDIVQAGQVLVEAENGVPPSAQIFAKVWYVGTAFHFEKTTELVPTGKKQVSKAIKMFGKTVIGHSKCKFEYFEKETSTKKFENLFLPVEIERVEYKQMQIKIVEHDFEQDKQQIFEKAKAEALTKTNAEPTECTYSVVREKGTTKVDCYIEVVEEIGEKQ